MAYWMYNELFYFQNNEIKILLNLNYYLYLINYKIIDMNYVIRNKN
jgi:hypothetical protein